MKRGDVVIVALAGDLGKPRPAVIVETDRLAPTDHVILCPGTTHLRDDVSQRRLYVEPTERNGLREITQFQIDKTTVSRRDKCGEIVGHLEQRDIERLNETLVLVLGLAD